MITITRLDTCTSEDLARVITRYVSREKYVVKHTTTEQHTAFTLDLMALEQPYVKPYHHLDDATLQRYQTLLPLGYSVGAYDDDVLVGLALVEPQEWNSSLVVCEFHVAETHQRLGIGRKLMDHVAEVGRNAGMRTIVCETQTTNVTAIRFYRSVGFVIEGIDISYYTNHDYPDGEIAVFLKRRLV